MTNNLIFIDCEAPFGKGSPAVADMTEFGAVAFKSRITFHGRDCTKQTFVNFERWLGEVCTGSPIMVSDNPAYDWQWINFYFWKHFGYNPLGHSARRIGDFYAGLTGDFRNASKWKKLRITKHDHNPVNDAMGNAEAFQRILNGER